MANYDVLIIGGGMAGCILATRIAEKGIHPRSGERLRVGLLERGPYFSGNPRPGHGIPLRRKMFTNISSEFRQGARYSMGVFPTVRELILGNSSNRSSGSVRVADAASILGGGSLHWDAKTAVPADLDYEAWADETGVDWTAEKFRAAGKEIHELFNIHARPQALLSRGDGLFRDTAQGFGYEINESMVAKRNCIGCGFCNSTDMCKYDAKMGPLITHIPLAEQLGVEIIPDAEVEKLILEKEGSRMVARGALYRHEGVTQSATAERVIVSCGSFGTPLLLFRSGYGPRDMLGSNLVVENSNVGRNMDAKPGAGGLSALFEDPVNIDDYHDGGYYFHHDVHPRKYTDRVEIGTGGAGGWRPPEFLAIGATAPPFGREHKEFMRNIRDPRASTPAKIATLRTLSISAVLVRPREVRGSIDANGRFQYELNHPSIVKRLVEAREMIREILQKMGPKEILSAGPVRVRSATMQLGSCRAGADRSSSVVNSDFESHDVQNLLICDGSALPREASHGYGAPVATLATYAAGRLVDKYFS